MTVHTWCTDLSCCWGFLHNAERSGTARATESALPCVRRVTIVLHRFMAQVFEIVLTCCGTDQHEGGSCVAAPWMSSPPLGSFGTASDTQ